MNNVNLLLEQLITLCKQPFLDIGDLKEIYNKHCELNKVLTDKTDRCGYRVLSVDCSIVNPQTLLQLTQSVVDINNKLLDKMGFTSDRPIFEKDRFVIQKESDAFTVLHELYENLCLVLKVEKIENDLAFTDIDVLSKDSSECYNLLMHVKEANSKLRGGLWV